MAIKINVDTRWYYLNASPGELDTAAQKWRDLGKAGDDTATDVGKAANKVLDGDGQQWKGEVRNSYETHKTDLVSSMAGTKNIAEAVASALEGISTVLTNRQGDLDATRERITGMVANTLTGRTLVFTAADEKEKKAVLGSIRRCKAIRGQLDTQLEFYRLSLDATLQPFKDISDRWKKYLAKGAPDPFKSPPGAGGDKPAAIRLPDGTIIVNTGDGDEKTTVSTDAKGRVVVTVDGEEFRFPPGTKVTLRGGEGDDEVSVDSGSNADVTVLGGEGEDKITETWNGEEGKTDKDAPSGGKRTIIGGDGDDEVTVLGDDRVVSTGSGDDEVTDHGAGNYVYTEDGDDKSSTSNDGSRTSTGRGNDEYRGSGDGSHTVFSGEGDDVVHGGGGDDIVDAGSGNDMVQGHGGDDQLSGNQGADYLDGQDGDDVIDGGEGGDHIYGLDGNDTLAGGSGRDNMEGGEGIDSLVGGTGEDLMSGGKGDDYLHGGDGDDKLYTGDGKDFADGGEGDDTSFSQSEDIIGGETEKNTEVKVVNTDFIKIDGSEEYQDRVRADLDMLGSSPTGSKLIEALRTEVDQTHNDWAPGEQEIVIHEADGRSNVEQQLPFSGSDVNMNLDADDYHSGDDTGGSQAILVHELGHVYGNLADVKNDGDYINPADPDSEGGDPISNAERQATGLDYDFDGDGKVDDVHDPDNPHPYDITQNAFNEESGRSRREHYGENKDPRESEWYEFWR